MVDCKECAGQQEARKRWGPGPWQQEPDYEVLTAFGLPCQLHRSAFSWWCGYVGLPSTNMLFKADIHEIEPVVDVEANLNPFPFWVAGHIMTPPTTDSPGTWWVGFDFSRWGQAPADYGPMLRTGHLREWRYWGIEDARREVRKLAGQLARCRAKVPPGPRLKGHVVFS